VGSRLNKNRQPFIVSSIMQKPKVIFLGIDDPIYYVPFLDKIAAGARDHVVGIGIVTYSKHPLRMLKDYIAMSCVWGASVALRLFWLYGMKKINRAQGSGGMRAFARQRGIPFLGVTHDCNGARVKEWINATDPDVVVSTLTQKVDAQILRRVPQGFINTHLGTLPNYAGHFAPFWALSAGDKKIGTTIYRMGKDIDAGTLLSHYATEVRESESLHVLIERLLTRAANEIIRMLTTADFATRGAVPRAERMLPLPDRSAVKEFYRKGFSYF
jgi:folate-dependent phosphoribosylglycinamide formyltransferase PurN